ncbi:MAG: NADH-quinone oxidoreductase subunit M [Spirochaetota bacterium]|nr:NADH-quinone oxidoreductase subunit M [Spirochaetota bacterium]
MNYPLLSIVLLLPAVGAIILMFLPSDKMYKSGGRVTILKSVALLVSIITFLLSLPFFIEFGGLSTMFKSVGDGTVAIVQDQKVVGFKEFIPWLNLKSLGINASYNLRLDGISLLLFILTTFITPIILLASWKSVEFRVKEFVICMLLMETGMLGAFVAWDLLLFYVFWEVMLIPMYLIIGIWGSENKVYAAVKFFIYTMVGSLLMFLALIFVYTKTGTFDLAVIYKQLNQNHFATQLTVLGLNFTVEHILFLAFALSFAIKVPLFPFHTWLPDAHVQAPTAGSVILAGVLLKMGTYGFIRFTLPIFPNATVDFAPMISVLAVIGIIYGAFMALAQTDIKKLIAYSSVSHLGFVMLGLFAFTASKAVPGASDSAANLLSYQGVQGALYQMIGHGLSTGALFLLIGMIYERRHTKLMSEYGGLAKVMPVYAVIFMITTLSSIGLPGLNGFVGEFLILIGSFQANWLFGTLAASGVILGAVYMLILYQRVFFGEVTNPKNQSLKDLNFREVSLLVPMVILMILMGVVPNYFLDKMDITLMDMFKNIPNTNIGWLFK